MARQITGNANVSSTRAAQARRLMAVRMLVTHAGDTSSKTRIYVPSGHQGIALAGLVPTRPATILAPFLNRLAVCKLKKQSLEKFCCSK